MPAKSIKCPRCRKAPKGYDEIWAGHWIQFEADSNGVPSATGEFMDGGPVSVNASCSCGHVWRLRGVTCIDDLRNN